MMALPTVQCRGPEKRFHPDTQPPLFFNNMGFLSGIAQGGSDAFQANVREFESRIPLHLFWDRFLRVRKTDC